jgi:RNA polymerase sigma-70 factor, ECF subfamily
MTITLTHAKSAAAPTRARDSSADGAVSDEMLIGRIAAGDQFAMRTLFARHRIPLYRWLLRIVRDQTTAEDLLSDVFLDVWRQAASFKGRASVSTWLLAIARYKALSARRARVEAQLDERIASTIADPADNPEAALQEKNRSEVLRDSLANLSPEQGEVIEPRLLPRQVGQGGRRDRRRRRSHGEDAHVLCAQKARQPGRSCLTAWMLYRCLALGIKCFARSLLRRRH